jgi:hypothetical protein
MVRVFLSLHFSYEGVFVISFYEGITVTHDYETGTLHYTAQKYWIECTPL